MFENFKQFQCISILDKNYPIGLVYPEAMLAEISSFQLFNSQTCRTSRVRIDQNFNLALERTFDNAINVLELFSKILCKQDFHNCTIS